MEENAQDQANDVTQTNNAENDTADNKETNVRKHVTTIAINSDNQLDNDNLGSENNLCNKTVSDENQESTNNNDTSSRSTNENIKRQGVENIPNNQTESKEKANENTEQNTTPVEESQNNTVKPQNTTPIEDLQNNTAKPQNGSSTRKESLGKSMEKVSNYMQNIRNSSSAAVLRLDKDKDQKDPTLLPDSTTVARFSPIWKQSLTAAASILLTFTAGLTSGYSAILLPQLKEPGSIIAWDENTASWIAAMAALPMAPGCLLSGWMMERFGRKTSHYLVCAPFLIGWILIACASNLSLMLLGRFFTGLCTGLLGPLGPVYIGETTDPQYRGFFLAAVSLAIAIGILVAHLIGTFMTWQWTATICSVFPVLSFLLLMFVPESPTWLISKGKTEDGIKSFHWLRGYDDVAKAELKGLIDKQETINSEPKMSWKEKLTSLKSPELLKPLFIMIAFFITCQFAGVNAVAFYSIEIIEKSVGKGLDKYIAMIIIDTLRVVMSVVACVICKMYGRRPLCFISGIWTALSMVGLSMFIYFTGGEATDMSWLPLTCLLVYITAVSIGLVPLPWIMCGEVFPTRVRGLGSGISSATTFAAFFVVVKTAPGMMNNLGEVLTFLIYGVVALIGTVIMYFILPETKGKSLQEIEERFRYGKKGVGAA